MKLAALDFNEGSLNDFETCKAIITIFTELDLMNRFKIENNVSRTGSFMNYFSILIQLSSLNLSEICLHV